MKKLLLFLIVTLLTPLITFAEFNPKPNSPITKNVHPRLFLTPDTLPQFRKTVATPRSQNGLLEDYQKVVNYTDSVFNESWEDPVKFKGLLADYHALLYLVGPVPGITYGNSMEDYKFRAIAILLEGIQAPLNLGGQYNHNARKEIPWLVAKAYDWIYHELTNEQRTLIVNYLADSGIATLPTIINDKGGIKALWSTQVFAARFPWIYALAFYGDGIRDEDAKTIIDSFDTVMLNGGWLDAHNYAGSDKAGPTSEMGSYGLWNPWRFVLMLSQWRTATGINYFTEGTGLTEASFQWYPKSIAYFQSPIDSEVFLKWGQAGAGKTTNNGNAADVTRWLGSNLVNDNPEMDSLRRWVLNNWGYTDGASAPREGRQLDYVLTADLTSEPKSPSQLGLPLTFWMRGVSLVFMRSGFENPDDMAFVVGAPEYYLAGHTYGTKGGGIRSGAPFGFSIDKYGPLTFRKVSAMRGYTHGQRSNVMRFNFPGPIPADDLYGGLNNTMSAKVRNLKEYNPSSEWFRGGVTKLETFSENGEYDYIFTEITKNYVSERVKKYTRQFVYFRPDNLYNRDYIVIFDRVETTTPDMVKRWELNMAYKPEIDTDKKQLSIRNDLPEPYNDKQYGGHGKLTVSTLLPKNVNFKVYGGPGKEYLDDAGNWDEREKNTDINALKGAGAFYSGTYHTNVIPVENNNKENFLHVLQTGDTNNNSQLVPVKTELVETRSGNMQGAFIEGDVGQENAVVLFSAAEKLVTSEDEIIYTITGNGVTRQLIVDLYSGINYEIWDGNKK